MARKTDNASTAPAANPPRRSTRRVPSKAESTTSPATTSAIPPVATSIIPPAEAPKPPAKKNNKKKSKAGASSKKKANRGRRRKATTNAIQEEEVPAVQATTATTTEPQSTDAAGTEPSAPVVEQQVGIAAAGAPATTTDPIVASAPASTTPDANQTPVTPADTITTSSILADAPTYLAPRVRRGAAAFFAHRTLGLPTGSNIPATAVPAPTTTGGTDASTTTAIGANASEDQPSLPSSNTTNEGRRTRDSTRKGTEASKAAAASRAAAGKKRRVTEDSEELPSKKAKRDTEKGLEAVPEENGEASGSNHGEDDAVVLAPAAARGLEANDNESQDETHINNTNKADEPEPANAEGRSKSPGVVSSSAPLFEAAADDIWVTDPADGPAGFSFSNVAGREPVIPYSPLLEPRAPRGPLGFGARIFGPPQAGDPAGSSRAIDLDSEPTDEAYYDEDERREARRLARRRARWTQVELPEIDPLTKWMANKGPYGSMW